MWALLHFWNVRGCLCRCCLAWAPNSIAEADEVAQCQYFQVHSTLLRRGKTVTKTTWTLLGRRPLVRHGQHAAGLGIRWLSSRQGLSWRLCTSMPLGAAWRLIAGGLCMVPARAAQWSPLLVHDVTCHCHDDSLHQFTWNLQSITWM